MMKKRSVTKNILLALMVAIVVIQFFRTEKNEGEAYGPNNYSTVLSTDADVKRVLEDACFDCHSNHTNHMWYENIQPVGWWIHHHIEEGKEELNFSEFGKYSPKKQAHKLEEIAELVEEGEMPLKSYTWMHNEAKLTSEVRKAIIDWALSEKARIEASETKSAE